MGILAEILAFGYGAILIVRDAIGICILDDVVDDPPTDGGMQPGQWGYPP
jgi:hypothetical protein